MFLPVRLKCFCWFCQGEFSLAINAKKKFSFFFLFLVNFGNVSKVFNFVNHFPKIKRHMKEKKKTTFFKLLETVKKNTSYTNTKMKRCNYIWGFNTCISNSLFIFCCCNCHVHTIKIFYLYFDSTRYFPQCWFLKQKTKNNFFVHGKNFFLSVRNCLTLVQTLQNRACFVRFSN